MNAELEAEPIVQGDTDLIATIADLREQVQAQAQIIVGLTEELAELKADLWDAQHQTKEDGR